MCRFKLFVNSDHFRLTTVLDFRAPITCSAMKMFNVWRRPWQILKSVFYVTLKHLRWTVTKPILYS